MRPSNIIPTQGGNGNKRLGCSRRHCPIFAMAILFFLCWGCAEKQIIYQPLTLQKAAQKNTDSGQADLSQPPEKKAPLAYEELKSPTFGAPAAKSAAPAKEIPRRETIDFKRLGMKQDSVTINAENMPLSDFVIYALGETMKIAFVMDDKVMANKQPVTLRMPQPMAADKALELVVGLFEKYSVYLEERAGALHIMSKPPQPPSPSPYGVQFGRNVSDSPVEIIQVVPLKYSRSTEIGPLLQEVSRATIQMKPFYRGNVLLLYGQAEQIRKVMEVLDTFDVPYFENRNLFLLNFTYMKADVFISEMRTILPGIGYRIAQTPEDPGPLFMHIKQLNAVLVNAPDEKTALYIREWKDKMDTAESAGAMEMAFTFKPKYSKASDLVKSIQALYGIAPAATPGASPAGQVTPTAVVQAGAMGSLAGFKLSADDNKNMVVFIGTPASFKMVNDLLKNLDTPPKQVLIEATIIELTLTDELKYGVEWFIKNSQSGGNYNLGTLGHLGVSPLGLAYQFVSETANFQALVSAMATQNRANILSTPRLMVLDNKEATIQVGSDIPTVTGEVTSAAIPSTTTTPSVLRNITYRNTGVMLRVRPTINTEGLLTLDISQEVSQAGAAGVGDSPIILTRRINTTVIVGHGQTIALGGLMKDNDAMADSKVPILGDIPIIGNLFKYTSKTKEKTELIILVTPTILNTTDEAQIITVELKKELKWLKINDEKKP